MAWRQPRRQSETHTIAHYRTTTVVAQTPVISTYDVLAMSDGGIRGLEHNGKRVKETKAQFI